MDDLIKRTLAEDLQRNDWFWEVLNQYKEGLESVISSASLSNSEEVLEAAIKLRILKRLEHDLLFPLEDNI